MKIGRILDPTPDWESVDPNVRWQALQNRLPPDDVLLRLASCDSDRRVRCYATAHLKDSVLLATLCTDDDPDVAEAARRRWVQVFSNGETMSLDTVGDEILLAAVACFADSVELRLASLDRIHEDTLLAYVLERDNHASVHQECASRVEDEKTLDYLLRRIRGKDKNVTRILRQKMEDIRQAREQSSAISARCDRLLASFTHLCSDAHHDFFERRFSVLSEEWQDIVSNHAQEIAEETRSGIEAARRRCAETVDALAREREEQDAAARQAVARLESLTAQLMAGAGDLATLPATLESVRAQWPVGLAEDHEVTRHYYGLIAPLENLAAQYALCVELPGDEASIAQLRSSLARISWPENWHPPERLIAARTKLQSMIEAEEKHKAELEQALNRIAEQLQRLETSIAEGKLKPANKLHNALRKRFDGATIRIPRSHKEKLAKLTQQLRELQDWQGYVTVPKRMELCEQMERLRDDAALPAPEKAKAINDLQQRWKGLGPSNHRQSQQLWARFKRAADAAFEPCAAHFAQQRQVREQNLAERTRICDCLETLYEQTDWDNADWKSVNDIFIKARREWRQYEDVPHAKRKKVQTRFSRIVKQFDRTLFEEQQRNHARKQALVDNLKGLLEAPDPDIANLVRETKQAQAEWKQVGITERKTDQRLWKVFREQCDIVFKLRDEQSQSDKDTLVAAKSAAQNVSMKLKRLVASNDIDRAQLKSLRSEFDAVAPDKPSDEINKEFNRHVRQAEKVLKDQTTVSQREMMDEVRRKADICLKLEQGEMTPEAAETTWHSETEVEPVLLARLNERRAAGNLDNATLEANRKAAELLCVRIEIMAELPSPPEAQSVRMQYQVDRLNRELSRGQKDLRPPQQQLHDLLVEWYSLGALPNDTTALRMRFRRAEEKLTP